MGPGHDAEPDLLFISVTDKLFDTFDTWCVRNEGVTLSFLVLTLTHEIKVKDKNL